MKTKTIYLCVLLMITFSCKKESNKSKTTLEAQEIQLKLNYGEKWHVNQETHDGIKNMDSIIKAFRNTSKSDYKFLAKNLSKQTSYIIKKCDMKGESHDQLHAVLVPMLDETSILKDSNDKNVSEKALRKIEQLITDYFNHFKL